MKKAILLAALFCVAATPAFASSLFLRWEACFGDAGALAAKPFACDGSINTLFMTYQLSAATPGVVALSGGVDFAVEGATSLPSFWQMDPAGCNSTGLGISDARGATCTTPNGGTLFTGSTGSTTDAFVTAVLPGVGGANRCRILWAVVRASSNPANLTAIRHFAGKFEFTEDNAEEIGGACAGCLAPVAMVANWILLESPVQGGGDAVAGYITSTDPGSDCVTLLNGATNGVVVPTRNRTWGQVKNLYR